MSIWFPQRNFYCYNDALQKHKSDGDIDFFNIVAGVMKGDTLALFLFIICLDYIQTLIDLRKENGFILKTTRSRQNPVETIMDADYADDLMLLTNTPVQAECLLHSLEQATKGIDHYVNSDKTVHMF